jgi:hypothetical protein
VYVYGGMGAQSFAFSDFRPFKVGNIKKEWKFLKVRQSLL